MLIGLFAFSRLLGDVRDRETSRKRLGGRDTHIVHIDYLHSARLVLVRWINLLRSSFLGIFIGVLPAAGQHDLQRGRLRSGEEGVERA